MAKPKRVPAICLECKNRFMVVARDLKRGYGHFCSLRCRSLARFDFALKTGRSDATRPSQEAHP